MNEIFLTAIEKLTDPIAIVLIVSMAINVLFAINATRVLPKIHGILGKHTALLEVMVYGKKDD